MASDEGILTEGGVQGQPWTTHPKKLMLTVTVQLIDVLV